MWFWLLTAPALAGIPVVTDGGDATLAPALVAERTGLPVTQLQSVDLARLLTQPPQVLGQAVMRRCAGDATRMEQVRAELVRAEASWQKQERVAAFDHLDLSVAQLGCLGEMVDRQVAGRIFMLRGALEAERGETDAGLSEMRTALAFDPTLGWTSAFPIEGQVLLAEARLEPVDLAIEVVPAGTSSGPWVDGRTVGGDGAQVQVAAGLHLAQHPTSAGIRSAWLVVGGDTTLVLPGGFRRPILDLLAQPDSRAPVEHLLRATLPEFQAAYVAHDGWLWLLTIIDDEVDTAQLLAPPPPPQEEETGGKKTRKKKTRKKKSD